MFLAKLTRRQSGDTIIEVLVAMAIVSLVLGSSYAVINRTLANARQAQEHSEALKLLEGQFEQLHAAINDPLQVTSVKTLSTFCFNVSGTLTSGSCTSGIAGGTQYTLSIARTGAGPAYLFDGKIQWDNDHGGVDKVGLLYKDFIQ